MDVVLDTIATHGPLAVAIDASHKVRHPIRIYRFPSVLGLH
jgi:hypothetical protein